MNPKEILDRYLALPQSQRFLIVGGVLLAIFFLFLYFSYLPARSKAGRLEKELAKLMSTKMQKERLAAELDKFQKEVNMLKLQLEEAKKVLPEKTDVSSLLTEISQKASEAGVSIVSFQPKGESPKGFYAEMKFDLTVEGGYHDIATFIDAVSRTKRILTVKDISLKVRAGGGDRKKKKRKTVTLSARMQLLSYRFIPAQAAGPGGVPPRAGMRR